MLIELDIVAVMRRRVHLHFSGLAVRHLVHKLPRINEMQVYGLRKNYFDPVVQNGKMPFCMGRPKKKKDQSNYVSGLLRGAGQKPSGTCGLMCGFRMKPSNSRGEIATGNIPQTYKLKFQ